MVKNGAIIRITEKELKSALGLPDGIRILGVHQSLAGTLDGVFNIIVEHENFPERLEGSEPKIMGLSALLAAIKWSQENSESNGPRT